MTEEKTEDQEAAEIGQEFAEEIGQETKKITTKDTLKSVELNDAEVKVEKVDLKKVKADDLDAVTKDIYSEFNAFLETKADIKEDIGEKVLIPTGIRVLDAILGGGFPVGAFSIIVGQPGSGKSMLAIQTMAGAQQAYPGLITSFLDSEEATSIVRLANLGVRKPRIKPHTDITVEKVFKFIETLCLFKDQKGIVEQPSIVVWDSIANTLSQRERECDDINQVIGFKARLLSILIPKYVARCAQNNICFLAVNQLRDTIGIGPYSAPKDLRFLSTGKTMPGGTILKYNAFTLLEMKAKQALTADAGYGFDGILVSAKTVKCKLFSPNIEVNLVGSFVRGFSDFWTSYKFMVDEKRLKAGAWNYLVAYPEKKFRTKDAEALYADDPTFRDAFDKALDECIEVEINQKYNPVIE